MGSQTFGSTIITQSKLGMFHVSAVILVLIWMLSPLGSQSSLQIVHLEHRQDNVTNYTVSYFDTSAKPGFATPNFKAGVSLNALFSSVLMGVKPPSPDDPLVNTMDPFDNVFIPDLGHLMQFAIQEPGTGAVFEANATGCEFINVFFRTNLSTLAFHDNPLSRRIPNLTPMSI
jgi:hypothetical protein